MRSRYAAFALGEVKYLVRTLHPDHEDASLAGATLEAHLRDATRTLRFLELRVLDAHEAGSTAQVLFFARVFAKGVDRSFLERSDFENVAGAWRYRGGSLRDHSSREPLPAGLSLARFDDLVGVGG